MHLTTHVDPRSPAPFTSGYGVVMEQEHELQSATEKALDAVGGPRAADVGRILHHHYTLLGENITRLEQLYESLPHADRFQALHRVPSPLSKTLPTIAGPKGSGVLPALVAQHHNVATNIDKLLARPHDGLGDAYLTEVAQNHDEMVWVLTALITVDETEPDRPAAPGDEDPASGTAEREWENEGGARKGVVESP